ncbi:peptidoglycan-binding protein [Streptomyces sp. NPDC096193]|uniref:peptidoglycan-binding protein n=2 Tax=unclassified Streptomyces TaxID=2593676 RepID=UPI003333CD22
MTVPVFEEYEPAPDCDCPGCAQQRRALAAGEHPAAHGCRKALVLVTAAGVVLGGGGAGAAHASAPAAGRAHPGISGPDTAMAPADDPDSEQGGRGPLHGRPLAGPSGKPATAPELRKTTRAEIINRAKKWLAAKVPYSMEAYWSDGYRQDCSGYVSMAWNLVGNEWTGSLHQFATRITREELQPGDMLLFHNPANPTKGSHVTLFGGWTDYTHTSYVAYEQTRPSTRKQATPMGYWTNSDKYIPYRYKGLSGVTTTPGPSAGDAFPGAASFGPGKNNKHVTDLGRMLVARGGKRFYTEGPGPRWTEADRRATRAFQLAQGWRGAEADGLPGAHTWRLLTGGQGRNIPAAGVAGPGSVTAPAFPGRGHFRPGQSNAYVTQLGKQLVKRGFGKHYTTGPGPRWTEADRRNVEAFQRSLGWRGAEADGYPGPHTWSKLFAAAR